MCSQEPATALYLEIDESSPYYHPITLSFTLILPSHIRLGIPSVFFVARGSVVVKALCYKPEGHGFDTRAGEFLNLPNPSGRTRPWGLLSQ
jgi:hypothetical protein